MIVVDTSALIDSLSGPRRSAPRLRALIAQGERLVVPALVLYEWWCGPRLEAELDAQEALWPRDEALPFGPPEAATAAALYSRVPRPRGREIDLAIAAHALVRDAVLWTLNRDDFADVPGLALLAGALARGYRPAWVSAASAQARPVPAAQPCGRHRLNPRFMSTTRRSYSRGDLERKAWSQGSSTSAEASFGSPRGASGWSRIRHAGPFHGRRRARGGIAPRQETRTR